MSFFTALFGRPKTESSAAPSHTTNVNRSRPDVPSGQSSITDATTRNQIQSNDEKIQLFEKKITILEGEIQELKVKAKAKLDKGDKTGALALLKRSKGKEQLLATTFSGIGKLQEMNDALQAQLINKTLVEELARGTKAMGKNAIDVGHVDDVMDELEEQMSNIHATTEALNRPTAGQADDDELLAELEGFTPDAQATSAPAAPAQAAPSIALPQVPTGAIKTPKSAAVSEEDAMLAALRAEMGNA